VVCRSAARRLVGHEIIGGGLGRQLGSGRSAGTPTYVIAKRHTYLCKPSGARKIIECKFGALLIVGTNTIMT
jgi:hypothetical protein